MDEKDTLGKMFMDMGNAHRWSSEAEAAHGLSYWTDQIDDFTTKVEENTDELGWAAEGPEFVTLYQFLGQSAGKDLGQTIFNESLVMGVKSIKKGQYRAYPTAWLEMWFRDYDAQLSMEVYNKARAKEALKQISNQK